MTDLTLELAFTETYDRYRNAHPATREAACLRVQLPALLEPPRGDDLYCGRVGDMAVKFTTQDGGMGYRRNAHLLARMAADDALDAAIRDRAAYLLEYWRMENTNSRVRSAYPPHLAHMLPDDDAFGTSGVAFPLYRLGGAYLDFEKLLRLGLTGLEDEVRGRSDQASGGNPVLAAMLDILALQKDLCRQYASMARTAAATACTARRAELATMASVLDKLAGSPPESFREAIQLCWLFIASANVRNYGRMDIFLGPFLKRDLASGVLTDESALDLVVGIWRLMADRCTIWDGRVVVGGMGRPDPDAADRFALLAIEATRRVPGSDPQLTLRWHQGMSPALMDKALDVLGEGRTFPMLYNDDVNVPAAAKAFGVDLEMAKQYVPFGCGEYVLDHGSIGTPSGVMNLLKALEVTLHDGIDPLTGLRKGPETSVGSIETFEELFDAYRRTSEPYIEALAEQEALEYRVAGEQAAFLFISVLYDDCIARGKALLSGGVRHLGGTLEAYGNTNTADSLTAIKSVVYDDRRVSLPALVAALDADFAGTDELRDALVAAPKYGNNDAGADAMAVRVHEHFCCTVRAQAAKVGMDSYLTVVINNSANTSLGRYTGASADGRRARQPMANANAPSGGSDRKGLTALIHSLVKLSPDIHAGVVQNMKFTKEMFRSQRPKLQGVLDAYFATGGTQAMITAIDRGELERAMEHPELYPNLFVRVGGFSARFVDLPRDVQREILSRTLYG
ncbi:MAG: pyruvate formate lyase family protein [Capsulimonadaceae bacterium]|nr:pyruvate formate lyase family protein [Capsulimonadaceae bacterium]